MNLKSWLVGGKKNPSLWSLQVIFFNELLSSFPLLINLNGFECVKQFFFAKPYPCRGFDNSIRKEYRLLALGQLGCIT
jgi:hypothetical protein